jgi:hypothetical protein
MEKLENENEAKSKYYDWIHEIAVAGSNNTLPRAYLTIE